MVRAPGPKRVRFGIFEIDLDLGELRKYGIRIKLQQKPFQILALLIERPSEIITRDELRQRLWPSDVFVDFESSVNNAVKKLRAALGDSAEEPRFIETVAGQGYRFIVTPQSIDDVAAVPEPPLPGKAPPSRFSRRWVAVAAAVLVGLAGALWVAQQWRHRPAPASSRIHRIAVLPLENLSRDEQQEYFADGMTDALIDELARVKDVTVISRTSTMLYKRTRKPLPQIARELKVDAVVEGTVLRSENRVRVSAQFIDANTNGHLLSQTFDRDLSDVFKLQQDVARAVAQQIERKLNPEDPARLSHRVSANPEAYQAFLLGRFHWFKRTPDGMWKSVEYFQQAIARDPQYALAYVGLADAYFGLQYTAVVPPQQFKTQERSAILKAIALDDSLAEAYTSLGHLQEYEDWDFEAGEKQYRRAVELNPNYSLAHHWLGNNLAIRGKSEEALLESRRAVALDPISALYRASYAHRIAYARRFEEAAAECKKAVDLDSNHPGVNLYMGQIEEYLGAYPNAIARFQKAYDLTGAPRYLAAVGHARAMQGDRNEALSIVARLRTISKTRYVTPYSFAIVYMGLGDRDNAFLWLDKAVVDRDEWVVGMKMDPLFDNMRSDARFDALCRRVGL